MNLSDYIREIPDFPKEGILFKDITPLLQDTTAFRQAIDRMAEHYQELEFDYIAGIEARGFLLGPTLAYKFDKGFIPIRKPGKLPADKISASYELEYGTNTLEMHRDAFKPGDKVLLVDDLLATGGTARAAVELIESLEGEVTGIGFLIELVDLNGRGDLEGYDVYSLLEE